MDLCNPHCQNRGACRLPCLSIPLQFFPRLNHGPACFLTLYFLCTVFMIPCFPGNMYLHKKLFREFPKDHPLPAPWKIPSIFQSPDVQMPAHRRKVPHSVLVPLSRIWHLPTVDNRVRQTAPGSDDDVRSLDGSLPMTAPVLLFLLYPPPGNQFCSFRPGYPLTTIFDTLAFSSFNR